MNLKYIQEKLFGAVDCLVSSRPMKERLGGAYLCLAFIPEDQMPIEIRKQFNHLMQLVRTNKARTTDLKIKSAIRKMTIPIQNDMAKIILGMFTDVTLMMETKSIKHET